MSAERLRQLEKIFHDALERQPDERAAFLDSVCGHDSLMRDEIEDLIRSDEKDSGLLESSAIEIVLSSKAAVTPGSRFGPYEVHSAIGAGGMGEVYRARDTKLGRDVAIKLLPSAFTSDPDRVARRPHRMDAGARLPRVVLRGSTRGPDRIPGLRRRPTSCPPRVGSSRRAIPRRSDGRGTS